MKIPHCIKAIAVLAASVAMAPADSLFEFSWVSDKPVPQSRKMEYHTAVGRTEAIHVMDKPLITAIDVSDISIGKNPIGLAVNLTDDGAKKLAAATKGMTGRRIAVVIGNRVLSAPIIKSAPLGRHFYIELAGAKDESEAKAIVEAFNKSKEGKPATPANRP